MRAFNAVLVVAVLAIVGIQVYRATSPNVRRVPAGAMPAASHLYFHDATVDMLASERPAPACTVRFRPAMTYGGNLAPSLVLAAKGPSRFTFGIENPEQYSNPVIVQHNTRTPLAGADNVGVDQFQNSGLAAALRSQKLFYITARRAGTGRDAGRYVSSRYEHIDLAMIMAKIEACRSDASPPAVAAAPTLDVRRFDGAWRADLVCDSTSAGLVGWQFQFIGRISSGVFTGGHGFGFDLRTYYGRVGPDGSITIWEKSVSTDPVADPLHRRPKGVFQSIYTGKLDRLHGDVKRYDRPCHMTLGKL